MKERKIEITIESYEVRGIRQDGRLNRLWCSSCDKQVAVISLNDACMAGLTIEVAQRQEESGWLHLLETTEGFSFVCLDSLVRTASTGQGKNPPANRIHKI